MDAAQRHAMLTGLEAELARNQEDAQRYKTLLASETEARKTAERLLELAEQRRSEAESSMRDAHVLSEERRRNSAKSAYDLAASQDALKDERTRHEKTRAIIKDLQAANTGLQSQLQRSDHDLAASEAKVSALQTGAADVRQANARIVNEMAAVRKERDIERARHGDTRTRMKTLEDRLAVEAGQRKRITNELADALAMVDALKGELAALRQR